MVPSRILVATDGSQSAKMAEAFAAEMATAENAKTIVVVTVIREYPARGVVAFTAAEPYTSEETVNEAVEHIRKILGPSPILIEKKLIRSLNVADAIVEEAHATDACSHIVMGDRGHGELTSLLLGSTSHEVVQKAHCPVTIIRA